MLNELYELYFSLFALPKTWNPIKLAQRKLLRDELMNRINAEVDSRISAAKLSS